MRLATACVLLAIFGGCTFAARTEEVGGTYRAAADSAKITPEKNSFMGGYLTDPPRVAEGKNDDLYARCLIIHDEKQNKVIFVSVDLVGLLRYDVELIRSRLPKEDADRLFIFATHTHSGPDTIGLWGGRDEKYMAELRDKIRDLVISTERNLKDAELYVTQTSGAGLNRNDKPSGLDDKITGLFVKQADAYRLIGALVNFGCHPETAGKKTLRYSADFPGSLSQKLEDKLGAPALFANGALGGMVTVNTEALDNKDKGAKQTKEFTDKLVEKVFPPEISSKYYKQVLSKILVERERVGIKLDSPRMKAAVDKGVIPSSRETYDGSSVYTEVATVTLGDFRILMMPGEPTPDFARQARDLWKNPNPAIPSVVFGLANDEIGYIINSGSYNLPCFEQEREKSLGAKTGDAILEAFRKFSSPP